MSLLGRLFGKNIKSELDYSEGDKVKIIDGAFNGFNGTVKMAKTKNNRIEIAIDIGKTPVISELRYNQVEKTKE